MSGRFSAFSFVDRICRRGTGRIEGLYTVPAHASRFPASLMAEAVGQLAAWWAMASLDFGLRPVAGLAAQSRYHETVRPGQTLMLEADIARCDAEAVAYSGRAVIDGRCALELVDCIGPMLPMAQFDAPETVRADFDALCGSGATPARFGGVPAPDFEQTGHEPGRRLSAVQRIPTRDEAAFFADHFPRRPVYPGTLLLDALGLLAVRLASDAIPEQADREWMPWVVTDVKLRTFTPPGARLDLGAELIDADAQGARMKVTARDGGKLVASARIEVGPASERLA
jgi:3-hydroxymyristoyl/3-hydroxydecanoyl-(acyl carrier protein) dehydratase